MKPPLTKKYYEDSISSMITDKKSRKLLTTYFDNLEKAEKALLKSPCDAGNAQTMRDAMSNVQTTLLKNKTKDPNFKKEVVNVAKALKKFTKDYNSKIVDKISSHTIGSVPGGMKALEKQSKKEFTSESYTFMRDSQKAKKEGTQLQGIFKKYVQDINISSKTKKDWIKASGNEFWVVQELKKKENKTNPDKRKELLKQHKVRVEEFYNITGKARDEIVKMMNDSILRMKERIMLK